MSYSAQEVMEILDKAKASGVRFIKIPGFEATWDVGANQATPKARESSPSKGDELGDFVTTFGKFRGRRLREIPKSELQEYGEYLLRDTGRDGLSPTAREWVDKADLWLRRA